MHGIRNVGVTGDYINNSKNCRECFSSRNIENCAYSQFVLFGDSHNSQDISFVAGDLCYEMSGAGGYDNKFIWDSATSDLKGGNPDLTYCMRCFDSHDL